MKLLCTNVFLAACLLATLACRGGRNVEPLARPVEASAQQDPKNAEDEIGGPDCVDKSDQPLDAEWTITSGGLERTVLVHVPAVYDASRSTPLVVNLHGYMADAAAQQATAKMDDKSDLEGFISMHPNGTGSPKSWNAGPCCGAPPSDVDDVQFIRDLLATAEERLCVDADRISATGYSNGGFMAHRLACELSDRITSIGAVGGPLLEIDCNPARPVSVVHFHGDADNFVPYGGKPSFGYPPIETSLAAWAARNGCGTATEEVFANGDSTCRSYVDCPEGGAVTLCTIAGGGHTWPGGLVVSELGKTTSEISATDYMWKFFEQRRHAPL